MLPGPKDPVDEIRAVCAACPVLAECRAWAAGQSVLLKGFWGGLTEV